MRKIYFIYVAIPEEIFNKVKYMLGNTERYRWKRNKMFGLYGWTTSKSIVKEFFEIRNKDIYTLVKKDIDDEEYQRIKDDLNILKLDRRTYNLNDIQHKKIDIVSTKNEYVCVTIDSEQYIWEFGPPIDKDLPYNIFNDKICNALDILGYSKGYELRYGDEDILDQTSYDMSFGLTPMGNKDLIHYDNEMNILLYLFKYFFYGDKKDEVEE